MPTPSDGEIYYGDYLALDDILRAQRPVSSKDGPDGESHDEMLFIVVHQVYELWFKQILHELDSIQANFSRDFVEERNLSAALAGLERIKKIQHLLLGQIEVMESMTPMDFLQFRDALSPASGFQSWQFREITLRLGLTDQGEIEPFMRRLKEAHQRHLQKVAQGPNLWGQLQAWLERMPFTRRQYFDFWREYKSGVEKMLAQDRSTIEANRARLSPSEKAFQLEQLRANEDSFASLFEEESYEKWRGHGRCRWSHRAFFNALFIFVYRHEGILNLPYLCLSAVRDIDENWVAWRYRHALMAERQLGSKIGTGGSSGGEFLLKRAQNSRIYTDFPLITTLLIPDKFLPRLPDKLRGELNFKV